MKNKQHMINMGDTVVVMGSNSFSGSHMINYLLENTSSNIIGISRSEEKNPVMLSYRYNKNPDNFIFHRFDINIDLDKIFRLIDSYEPNIIINFMAQGEVNPSWVNPVDWYTTNALGVVKLTNWLLDKEYLERYVHVSTTEVYGSCDSSISEDMQYYNPSTPYAASKASGDMFINALMKSKDFPATIIRSTNLYGMHQQLYRIIPKTIIKLLNGEKIGLEGGGYAIKSFVNVKDVMRGIYLSYKKGNIGYYNFSSNEKRKISDIVKTICNHLDCDFYDSIEIVGDRIGQDEKYMIDYGKATKELGWVPEISFDDGLDDVVTWIKDEWDYIKNQPLIYKHRM